MPCCAWGNCKSSSQTEDKLPKGVKFIPFPKPGNFRDDMTEQEKTAVKAKREKTMRWLYLCGRRKVNSSMIEHVTKNTYICSLHFDTLAGPTDECPEPYLNLATATLSGREQERRKTKRKTPQVRDASIASQKLKTTEEQDPGVRPSTNPQEQQQDMDDTTQNCGCDINPTYFKSDPSSSIEMIIKTEDNREQQQDIENAEQNFEFGCDINQTYLKSDASSSREMIIKTEDNQEQQQDMENTEQDYEFGCDINQTYFNSDASSLTVSEIRIKTEDIQDNNLLRIDDPMTITNSVGQFIGLNMRSSLEQGPHEDSTNNIINGHKFTTLEQETKYVAPTDNTTSEDLLKDNHLNEHTREQPHICSVCGQGFTQEAYLNRHKIDHHTGEIKCHICEVYFTRPQDLKKHNTLIHNVTGRIHYKCGICGKYFTQKKHLESHGITHTGEKPFKCDVCGKPFSSLEYIRKHKKIHSAEKPYKCDVCGKCFRQSQGLYSHVKIHHEKHPNICEICGKSFIRVTYLNRHKQVTHFGVKPYKCDVCGKCFDTAAYLKSHGTIHTGEKPFKCDICGKCFICISSINLHKRNFHKKTTQI